MAVTITSREHDCPIVVLTGRLTSQSELLLVLDALYDLGLPLLSVERVTTTEHGNPLGAP